MMVHGNVKMALSSLKQSRWRSLLTMLGIIIGVVSVVTTVSLGEGFKQQVTGQVDHFGNDLITVRPGTQSPNIKNVANVGLLSGASSSSLTESDVSTIKQVPGVEKVAPVAISGGIAEVDGVKLQDGVIIATTEDFPNVVNQKVEFGTFLTDAEQNRQVVVIGKRVAEELFQENVPIGHVLKIRGQDFIVRGIFEEFDKMPLGSGADLNKAVFIPYQVAKTVTEGATPIVQVFVKASDQKKAPETVDAIRAKLTGTHAGQEDFTVLKQEDTLAATNEIVGIITQLITAVAALSLLVGGIGIMNIMLVSVSERTREIGIRKAVGATNRQILNQFVIEASVLSLVGGLVGVILAIGANFLIRIFTDLHPVVTIPVIIIAVGCSWIVGVFFGITPAIRAARKDPIEALRYE